jgi:hypothetical protein
MKIKAIVIFIFSSIIAETNDLWNGVSIDVIVTISIFMAGLLVKYIYDFCKERNRLKSIKSYFIKLTKSLYAPIKVQSLSYATISNKIKDFKKYDFAFEENPRLNTEGFKQVSQYDYYKSIILKSKKKNRDSIYNSFIITINIIKSIELQKEFANINYRAFTLRHREYTNDWNSSLEKLLNSFNNLLNCEKDDSDFTIDIKSLIMNIGDIGNDKELIYKKIIDPLYKSCNKHSNDISSSIFLEIANSMNKSYNDIKNLRDIYSKLFNNFSNKLNFMQQELINNIKVLEINKVNN